MGVMLTECPVLSSDLAKIIGAFEVASDPNTIFPIDWSPEYITSYNRSNPLALVLNGMPAKAYITVSITCSFKKVQLTVFLL